MKVRGFEPALKDFAMGTLASIPLFARMDKRILAILLEKGRLVDFAQGELLMAENDEAKSLFVLLDGSVQAFVERKPNPFVEASADDEILLGEIDAPAVVGEVGFLIESRRVASVRAKTAIQTLEIPRKLFFALFEHTKGFGLAIAQGLASRLASTSALVIENTIECTRQKRQAASEPVDFGLLF